MIKRMRPPIPIYMASLPIVLGLGNVTIAVGAKFRSQQPVTVAEPCVFTVQAPPPDSSTLATPRASIFAELLTLARTCDGPSAPIVASFTARPEASSEELPRTIAVSFGTVPATLTLPAPESPTSSRSTLALPIVTDPDPCTARLNDRPLILLIASDPAPLTQAADRSPVPTLTSTGAARLARIAAPVRRVRPDDQSPALLVDGDAVERAGRSDDLGERARRRSSR